MGARVSGRAEVHADLARLRTLFDLTRGGLGATLCGIATDGVMDNLADEKDADGNRFAALSPDYEAWKSRNFPGQPIGLLHHLMADPAQVSGVPDVSRDRAAVTYGVSEEAREEAAWFIEGDPERNRPARDFWGLTREALRLVDETLEERLDSVP